MTRTDNRANTVLEDQPYVTVLYLERFRLLLQVRQQETYADDPRKLPSRSSSGAVRLEFKFGSSFVP